MPSYNENRAAAYCCLEELEIDLMNVRACTTGWYISVIARMPQKRITVKMKVGAIFGQQLAVQAYMFLETIGKSCYPVTDSWMLIREQEPAGACYICENHGHTSVDYPRLKSGGPQNKVECMGKWNWSPITSQELKKVLIKIYCIEKCLLDLDPI